MTAQNALLPPALEEIAEDFSSASSSEKLQLLLEFSDELPGLPERYQGHDELLERAQQTEDASQRCIAERAR